MKKIICVVVTYNRLVKLKKALDSYRTQTVLPYKLLVVDNNSTDGTVEYLQEWKEKEEGFIKEVEFLSENTGGAGGFYRGIKLALMEPSDWIYISDDDAYLEQDVLEKILVCSENVDANVGAICGTVMEGDEIGYYHRRVFKEGLLYLKERNLKKDDYRREYMELSTYSFVGSALRTDAIWAIGLPNKDFFLWYDDTEHGIRMAKRYKVRLYPDILIYHDVEQANATITWKKYYGYRNKLLMIKYNYSSIFFIVQIFMLRVSMIRDFISARRRPLIRMKKIAISDAKNNITGVSSVYYPGAKIK